MPAATDPSYWASRLRVVRIDDAANLHNNHWCIITSRGTKNTRVTPLSAISTTPKVNYLLPVAKLKGPLLVHRHNIDPTTKLPTFPCHLYDETAKTWSLVDHNAADPVPTAAPPVPTRATRPPFTPPAGTPVAAGAVGAGLPEEPPKPAPIPADYIPILDHREAKSVMRRIPHTRGRMIWGPPGCGKSDLVAQIGEDSGAQIWDVRLGHYDPQEIKGLIIPDITRKEAFTIRPDFLPPENYTGPCILFFDEMPSAVPATLAAAYQIVHDRRAGVHKLPPQTIIYCAGNRDTDRGVAYRLPSPLANRLFHFEMKMDFPVWRAWALSKNIDPRIIGYLAFKPNALFNMTKDNADKAWASPRSWANSSESIAGCPDDVAALILSGFVGTRQARDFQKYCRSDWRHWDFPAILRGAAIPANIPVDKQVTVAIGLTGNSQETQIDRVLELISGFSPDTHSLALHCMVEKYGAEKLKTQQRFIRNPIAAAVLRALDE